MGMSREHLYKAKRVNWRELPKDEWWVEGFYVKCRKRHYILSVYDIDYGFDERYEDWIEVISETVCRYTSLTDKNNRKIFEGDIVLVDGEDKYFSVEWDNDTARFIMNCESLIVDFDNYWNYQVEVISNVFDNPELLEEGE